MNSDTCEGCGAPVVRGKHNVAFNVNPKDGLLHRQSCTNPLPVGESESVEDVKRRLRL